MVTEHERYLLSCPSIEQQYCALPWCGKAGTVEQHHVVYRSHTRNRKAKGPTVTLCKACHVRQHSVHRVEFEYDGEHWYADGKRCVTREVEPA